MPNHLPDYFREKPEFKPHGRMVSHSAADGACRLLVMRRARIPEADLKLIDAAPNRTIKAQPLLN